MIIQQLVSGLAAQTIGVGLADHQQTEKETEKEKRNPKTKSKEGKGCDFASDSFREAKNEKRHENDETTNPGALRSSFADRPQTAKGSVRNTQANEGKGIDPAYGFPPGPKAAKTLENDEHEELLSSFDDRRQTSKETVIQMRKTEGKAFDPAAGFPREPKDEKQRENDEKTDHEEQQSSLTDRKKTAKGSESESERSTKTKRGKECDCASDFARQAKAAELQEEKSHPAKERTM
jgi:hypothetical protein